MVYNMSALRVQTPFIVYQCSDRTQKDPARGVLSQLVLDLRDGWFIFREIACWLIYFVAGTLGFILPEIRALHWFYRYTRYSHAGAVYNSKRSESLSARQESSMKSRRHFSEINWRWKPERGWAWWKYVFWVGNLLGRRGEINGDLLWHDLPQNGLTINTCSKGLGSRHCVRLCSPK